MSQIEDSSKPWFVESPGPRQWFASEAEAVAWADSDLYEGLRDNDQLWLDEAVEYCVGKITHIATKVNVRRMPPTDELDECGCDDEGFNWTRCTEMCDYKMLPI